MSFPSLLILFLLTSSTAFSYTIITNSGKQIVGTLITEQESTIMIKDNHGVLISFKKQLLDLNAMAIANAPQLKKHGGNESQAKKHGPTLAEIAAESRKQRKGASKLLTLEDLKGTPELSILGTEMKTVSTGRKESHQEATEKQWESRIVTLKKEVSHLRERKISAEVSCEQAKQKQFARRTIPNEKPSNLLSTYKENPQCLRLQEIESQLTEAENRLEDVREEARRAGVSWQSLE